MRPYYEMAMKQSPGSPRGKIFGVVWCRSQLKLLCDCLGSIGIREIEILDGVPGLQRLDSWINRRKQLELDAGDCAILAQYQESLSDDRIVFMAGVAHGWEFEAMRLAVSQYAEHIHCVGSAAALKLLSFRVTGSRRE